jgi:hypothetical protein
MKRYVPFHNEAVALRGEAQKVDPVLEQVARQALHLGIV